MKTTSSLRSITLFLLLNTPGLLAQTWQWMRDDLALNPSGLDLRDAFDWAWGDLDHDGRLDVLVSKGPDLFHAQLTFYRGRASNEPPYWVEAPEFLSGFPGGLYYAGIMLADFDGDGYSNIVTHDYWQFPSRWLFLSWKKQAAGTWRADTLVFKEGELTEDDYNLFREAPFFSDADHDGDLDMLAGMDAPFGRIGVRFFENLGTGHGRMWREDSSRLALVYQNPPGYSAYNPILMNANADSLADLLVTAVVEGISRVVFYPGARDSLGTYWSGNHQELIRTFNGIYELWPVFISQEQRQALTGLYRGSGFMHLKTDSAFERSYFRVGSFHLYNGSSVIPFDYGDDGEVDLLTLENFDTISSSYVLLRSYQRKTLAGKKLWRNTDWFSAPPVSGGIINSKAQLVDLDRNGLLDFITASFPYYFEAFENSDNNFRGAWQRRNDLMAPFVNLGVRKDSLFYEPSFADLDGDNDLDLLITKGYLALTGLVKEKFEIYENHLQPDTLIWQQRDDWLIGLDDSVYAHNNFSDLDRDGDADLVLGSHDGTVLAYENIGNAIAPSWRFWSKVFVGIDVGDDAAPSFGDFDYDGRVDLFVGNRNGELFFYRNESTVSVAEQEQEQLCSFELSQSHPNPFNPETKVGFVVPSDAPKQRVLIKIYDLLGRLVAVLFDREVAPGRYEVVWNGKDLLGRDLPSGTYLYRLEAGGVAMAKRMTLVR